ncbi:MAG: nucleotidyltransferase family protein [Amphritea sp.]
MKSQQRLNCSKVSPQYGHFSIVVLAAGSSRRMGKCNKLLALVNETSMLEKTVIEALNAQPQEVIVVTGYEAEKVSRSVAGYDVRVIENPHYAEGLASSLSVGIGALSRTTDAVIVMLSDMPFVNQQHLEQLKKAFRHTRGEKILVPVYQGKGGNPLLWPRRYFTQMQSLSGDRGARVLLNKYQAGVCEVEMKDDGIFRDIDTPDQLLALETL